MGEALEEYSGRMRDSKVDFTVSVYKKSRAFNIPKHVCDSLGIKSGDSVNLIIRAPSGIQLFSGRKTLRSGPEIYGKDIAAALTPGSTITVEASEPMSAQAEAEAESFNVQELNAGFQSNSRIRSAVEEYAMAKAKDELQKQGFGDFKRTAETESYDYRCARDGKIYFVEVKGTQGKGAAEIEGWILGVV